MTASNYESIAFVTTLLSSRLSYTQRDIDRWWNTVNSGLNGLTPLAAWGQGFRADVVSVAGGNSPTFGATAGDAGTQDTTDTDPSLADFTLGETASEVGSTTEGAGVGDSSTDSPEPTESEGNPRGTTGGPEVGALDG